MTNQKTAQFGQIAVAVVPGNDGYIRCVSWSCPCLDTVTIGY